MTDDPFGPMRRFARREGSPEGPPDPLLCRHLRTKTWFSPDAFGQSDPGRSPSTAQYWCLRTMRPDGPDGDIAVPEECVEGRVCFEGMVRPGTDM